MEGVSVMYLVMSHRRRVLGNINFLFIFEAGKDGLVNIDIVANIESNQSGFAN